MHRSPARRQPRGRVRHIFRRPQQGGDRQPQPHRREHRSPPARPGPVTEKPQGEWNVFEIVVAGDTITSTVNGQFIQRMTGVLPSGGTIGFQSEGIPIDFRRIVLTPLPAAKNLNAAMSAR
ncbi:MAG: family 16 glycoside hydrolase [Opitutaceae bacterium]